MAEIEIEEVEYEASLTMLKDAARGVDTALSDAAAQSHARDKPAAKPREWRLTRDTLG